MTENVVRGDKNGDRERGRATGEGRGGEGSISLASYFIPAECANFRFSRRETLRLAGLLVTRLVTGASSARGSRRESLLFLRLLRARDSRRLSCILQETLLGVPGRSIIREQFRPALSRRFDVDPRSSRARGILFKEMLRLFLRFRSFACRAKI